MTLPSVFAPCTFGRLQLDISDVECAGDCLLPSALAGATALRALEFHWEGLECRPAALPKAQVWCVCAVYPLTPGLAAALGGWGCGQLVTSSSCQQLAAACSTAGVVCLALRWRYPWPPEVQA